MHSYMGVLPTENSGESPRSSNVCFCIPRVQRTGVSRSRSMRGVTVALTDDSDGPWDLTEMALAVGISAFFSGFFTSYFGK